MNKKYDEFFSAVQSSARDDSDFENRYQKAENQSFSYDVADDSRYKSEVTQRRKALSEMLNRLKGQYSQYSGGYSNSYSEYMQKSAKEKAEYDISNYAKALESSEKNLFDSKVQKKLNALKEKYKAKRYENLYAIGKLNEEYIKNQGQV